MTRAEEIQHVLSHIDLPPGITIRAWQPGDYLAVRELSDAEGWRTLTDRPEDGLRAWEQSWPALVATYQEQVIGFLRALTDGAITLYVAELLVSPEWRGQGIGCAMLELCHLLYPTIRFDLLSTDVADGFYQKQGFRPFRGFRKSYF